ncbi:hypothetical protein Q7P37_008632 [Cladosporium fusiforme]
MDIEGCNGFTQSPNNAAGFRRETDDDAEVGSPKNGKSGLAKLRYKQSSLNPLTHVQGSAHPSVRYGPMRASFRPPTAPSRTKPGLRLPSSQFYRLSPSNQIHRHFHLNGTSTNRRVKMGFFGQSRHSPDAPAPADAEKADQAPNITADAESKYESDSTDTQSLEARNEKEIQQHPDQVTADAHVGVQKAEAAALVWGKPALVLTYFWVWLCIFMLAFQSSIQLQAAQKGLGDQSTVPAISTANVLGAIIGGILKLPIAKTLNLWGRAEAWFLFLGVYLLGIIITATFDDTTGYSAGYTLYWIGYDALYLISDIFIADTSGLRNRAFAFAFIQTPFIITAFTGPLAAESFLENSTWRWAVGAFAIIQFVVFAPLGLLFKYYEKKAKKQGLFENRSSGRTVPQSIVHYFHEFDLVGALLIMAAFVLFLLPFSLQTYARLTYGSAAFIAMIVVGLLLFPVFAVWEKYFARTHFIRWELFKQRTVIGACMVAIAIQFSFYCWDQYFNQFVQIVYGLSYQKAGYMLQIYNVGSCFWGVVFGLWVRYSRHFKYECLCFGLPLGLLGAGLTIHFRGESGGNDIGYLIMCQIFIAFGSGTLVIGHQMAVMASSDREGVPMVLALLGLFASVGQAIGSAVIASIFAKVYPEAAATMLPPGSESLISTLQLGGAEAASAYAFGTPERDAANYATSQVQKWGGVAATCVLIIAIPGIAMWKNYRVDKKQNKGNVL